ncbi:MAG: hypothetical protein AABX55_01595 [Nanoarchaeota archaeon]
MIKSFKKLINSNQFKTWKTKHKNAYLCSCFMITDKDKGTGWQFDYYLPRINRITSFNVENNILVQENQKIFEKAKKKLNKLNLEEAKFSLDKALDIVNKKHKDKTFMKKIIILQKLNFLIWNISLLTNDFNLINIKINAVNGNIVEETSASLLQFKAS